MTRIPIRPWSLRAQVYWWLHDLRLWDVQEGDWWSNGWWTFPWNHSTSRFNRYLKRGVPLLTVCRWLAQDQSLLAAQHGKRPY